VYECSVPTGSQKHAGCADILGQRSERKPADTVKSIPSHDIARTCAPCDSQSILYRFRNVDECVEALAKRVIFGDIIELLGFN